VVSVGAEPVLYVERGGRGLLTLCPPEDPRLAAALEELADAVRGGRVGRLSVERVDGEPALGSPLSAQLVALGFRAGPRKLTLSA
jgi:ATP-dependent Lhr-like helicase